MPTDSTTIVDFYLNDLNARLFPLKKRRHIGDVDCKQPLIRGWRDSRFTTSRLIDYLSNGHPLGWALGPSDLVIDVDVSSEQRPHKRGNESLQMLQTLCGADLFKSAIRVESPSGGTHYYLTKSADYLIKKSHSDYPDIDFLSEGSYVVIAGSPHWEGGEYRLIDGPELERPSAPQELLDLLSRNLCRHDQSRLSLTRDVIDADQLRHLLSHLNPVHFRDYENWIRLLAACHSATDGQSAALGVFIDWSTADPQFCDAGPSIELKWQTFHVNRPGGCTLGTLFHLVRNAGADRAVKTVQAQLEFSRFANLQGTCASTPSLFEPNGQTDIANARRLVDKHGSLFRFVPKWNRWLFWDGKRWADDEGEVQILRHAKSTAEDLWDQFQSGVDDNLADSRQLQCAKSFVKSSNDSGRLKAAINLAKADSLMLLDYQLLNSNPLLLNLVNGTYDFSSDTFREHRPEDLLTLVAAVEYDSDADCPHWLEQLDLIFAGDQALAQWVQVYFGLCLTGLNGDEVLPICYGQGCNGKSTLWQVMASILGEYFSLAPGDIFTPQGPQHPTALASLFGKRLVAVNELESEQYLRESLVKSLLEKQVTARRMREDYWTFERTNKFLLATNHRPKVRGLDKGIWRRLLLVPFVEDISKRVQERGQELKKGFCEQLIAAEGPGILNWAIEGFRLYQQHGLDHFLPESVRVATDEYRNNEDLFGSFLQERLIVSPREKTLLSDVWDALDSWLGKERSPFARTREMANALRDRGYEVRASTGNRLYCFGVSLVRDQPEAADIFARTPPTWN